MKQTLENVKKVIVNNNFKRIVTVVKSNRLIVVNNSVKI